MPTTPTPQPLDATVDADHQANAQVTDDLADFLAELNEDPREREAAEDAKELYRLLRTLREVRRAAGLSQAAVADIMGTQQSAVSVLEGGDTDPQVTTLLRYARALGIRLPLRLTASGQRASAHPAPEATHWRSIAAKHTEAVRVRRIDSTGVVVAPVSWSRERAAS